MLSDIRRAWQWVREREPALQPISWFGHPFALEFVCGQGYEPGPEIRYQGFAPDLASALTEADIAVVPFNRSMPPEDEYAEYSLPSRLSELTMAGLPVFALECPGTALWEYVQDQGIGLCACPAGEGMETALLSFLQDRDLREKCGRRARELALAAFDL